jgi:hypothetical protein
MISIPTNDQSAALSILSSIARFSTLPETLGMMEWLKSELERLDAANRIELDKDIMRQRQGACQTLEKLLELTATADKTADKIRANQRKP